MKTGLSMKISAIILVAALCPALALYVCVVRLKTGGGAALAFCAAALCGGVPLATAAIMRGLGRPLNDAVETVRKFVAGGHRLDAPLAKRGWSEAEALISSINRVLLELNAYRAFHLNQVVEERAKAQALLETIADGVLLVDDHGGIIHSNRMAVELLGIAGEAPAILPAGVKREAFIGPLSELLASDEKFGKAEFTAPPDDGVSGGERSFRLISRQFNLASLKRPGRVITIRDVTMEKEIEGARETFFHMITHDMRSPISSIRGFTQLVLKQGPTGVTEKYLESILLASDRLKGMVDDILNIMKLERGEMQLNLSPIEAGELCARMCELHAPLAARKRITFSAGQTEEKLSFRGDAMLLERVISNLAGNALKFTPEGGSVTLGCQRRGREIEFSVTDTGPGVPEALREEIFRKHFQMDEHKHMGFGLGLAMCKMAVELHGGSIRAEPGSGGEGAAFVFSLPL